MPSVNGSPRRSMARRSTGMLGFDGTQSIDEGMTRQVSASSDSAQERARLQTFVQHLGGKDGSVPDGIDRHFQEAQDDSDELQQRFTEWSTLHPERADEVEQNRQTGEARRKDFEDDGTVDALLLAFTRGDISVRAQHPSREVPAGVESKLVHIVRHGQGFHNLLEGMPHGPNGLNQVEGVVKNPCEDVIDEGKSWLQMETFDGIFTSNLGPRKVVGIETTGATEFVVAYSADGGASWKELAPASSPSAQAPHKQAVFGKNSKNHPKGVMCTHVRVRPLNPIDARMKLAVLIPAVARAELMDPSLTSQGRAEAEASHQDALANNIKPKLVVVSPVTRATQTGLIVFQHLLDTKTGAPKVPFVAHEGLHERGGANTCDWRRPLPDLKRDFPNVDYSLIKRTDDPFWDPAREKQSSMIKRLYDFLLWLRDRPEDDIAIVAHCSINFTLLNAVVDCSIDPEIARWFCTGEMRTMQICYSQKAPERSTFTNEKSYIQDLATGLCQLFPNVVQLSPESLACAKDDVVSVRRDFTAHAEKGRVAVVTAGGSGHAPCWAGFVGEGLLTACVTGGEFAAPSPGAILQAIKHATAAGSGGCVLLVMNVAGVRFNSGVAAMHAERAGIKVKQVVVADDIARPVHNKRRKAGYEGRGLTGILFMLKVAGASAERGDTLEAVAEAANKVCQGVKSMAISQRHDEQGVMQVDVGAGIHGEPGTETLSSLSELHCAQDGVAHAVINRLMEEILPAADLQWGQRAVVLMNNLGGMSEMEMAILTSSACDYLAECGVEVAGLVKGTLMTCRRVQGISLSLLPLEDDGVLDLLAAPVAHSTAWPGMLPPFDSLVLDVPCREKSRALSKAGITANDQWLRQIVKEACKPLEKTETMRGLNEMDGECGDGDCGTTYHEMACLLGASVDSLPGAQAWELLAAISSELEMACSGAVGGIYVLGFEAAAECLKGCGKSEPGLQDWVAAARAALACIQEQGGAEEGDRTIVDAMAPAVKALEEQMAAGVDKAMEAALQAAIAGAKRTQFLVAKKGRAMYVPEKMQLRWQDAGAVGFVKWFEAVHKALRNADLLGARV